MLMGPMVWVVAVIQLLIELVPEFPAVVAAGPEVWFVEVPAGTEA